MSLMQYIHPAGFTIGNPFETDVCDGHAGDVLFIDDVGDNAVRFRYQNNSGSHRGSWTTASGKYSPAEDIITGTIKISPPGTGAARNGWFSIALNRTLPQPPARPDIHVFVKSSSGGAPDEGSYTGQGN
ncbi:MAG TPA: hypothetical protein VLF18_14515 [Tahibacter sp.]|uniref:hypothetical protein n=1 Tax=Tahibacter sp. TaxID=2056211 RepID=UPI002C00CD6F|nr:hypothetical protein [Tahibacter sp.]HSX61412.1 hypothetical protein [Tahibacter sp.]